MTPDAFVGAVVEPIDDERSRHFGACFALYSPAWFVTADHVVEAADDRGARALYVIGPGLEPTRVDAVHRHPLADVALLHVTHDSAVTPFAEVAEPDVDQAAHLFAYRGDHGEAIRTRVARLGHADPPMRRYRFDAFELAKPASRAFSGGPVFDDQDRVLGVYTHIVRDTDTTRGLALRLAVVTDWITHTLESRTEAASVG